MDAVSDSAAASTEIARGSVDNVSDAPCYSFAIRVKPDLDWFALTDALWVKSIAKWHQVFEILSFPGVLGKAVEYECLYSDDSGQGVALRDALGIKSPRTAVKRAQTLLQYFKWHQGAFSDWDPWNRLRCLNYLVGDGGKTTAASKGLSFLEAVRFAKYVMRIPIPDELVLDAQLKGRAQRLMLSREDYKPARPLKTSEVIAMEQGMMSDLDILDKYLLGCALFCLYSRSRWSDIQFLDSIWVDREEYNGEIFGFVETRTVHHKTATSLKKKRVFLPIVCPILGITKVDWTAEWFALWHALKLNMESEPFGALCRAPTASGELGKRSVTSEEISTFLNKFLHTTADNLVSSHSLKHTTLAWSSAYGMEEPLRTLLGHHELPGARSMAVYSRDMLTRPLQAYCAMLANIGGDHFRPDESRTSRLLDLMKIHDGANLDKRTDTEKTAPHLEPEAADAIDPYVGPATPLPSPVGPGNDVEESASSDSDLASTSSDSSDDSLPGGEASHSADFIDGPVWRNRKSFVVHKCSSRNNLTVCGRMVSEPNFELLEQGCSTLNARCSRCFKGEVITTVVGLAEALDAAKAKRLKVER